MGGGSVFRSRLYQPLRPDSKREFLAFLAFCNLNVKICLRETRLWNTSPQVNPTSDRMNSPSDLRRRGANNAKSPKGKSRTRSRGRDTASAKSPKPTPLSLSFLPDDHPPPPPSGKPITPKEKVGQFLRKRGEEGGGGGWGGSGVGVVYNMLLVTYSTCRVVVCQLH